MVVWAADFFCFLLLCVGSKLGTPRILRLICRIGAIYLLVFTVCYYFWLASQFRYFEIHPHLFQSGMLMAFKFQGFWPLLGNMVLVQGILPVAVVIILFLGIKWPAASPRIDYRR